MKRALKQIHATAPVRICDIGGWTDTWFAGHGAVFNIAVSPLAEVLITTSEQKTDKRVTIRLENYNETYSLDPDNISYKKHPLIEAAIDLIKIPPNISVEITISSKVPAGASVGTSAAVCVALVGALAALSKDQPIQPTQPTPHDIAFLAHRVETEKLGLQSGIQDQLCSAYGGFNFIDIHAFPNATVTQLKVPKPQSNELEKRLALVYIGSPHNSSAIHENVIADLGNDAAKDPRLERLRELAIEARNALQAGNLETLGHIMNNNTEMQRRLHPNLVCKKFEELIEIANEFKALGVKVNGAGGDGGSVTILGNGDEDKMKRLLDTLNEKGYHSIPISLSPNGLRVWME